MGTGTALIDLAGKGASLIDQAIIDKDLANQLKSDLMSKMTELMLTGKGASVTKITICGLVAVVVLSGTYTFLFNPGNFQNFKDYALFSASIIGMITGAYAAGTTIQTISTARQMRLEKRLKDE
jgi:hypothetical protein